MNSKWKAAGIILLAVALITITILTLNNEKQEIAELEPEKIYVGFNEDGLYETRKEMVDSLTELAEETTNEETVDAIEDIIAKVNMGEETLENFNRESAVNKLKEIMINVGNDDELLEEKTDEEIENKDEEIEKDTKDSRTIEDKLEILNNEETDIENVLSEEVIKDMYFAEDFGKEKFNRQFAASAMLIYHEIIRDSNEEGSFNPVIQSYDEIVYLDYKFMTAHIPLDVFVGSGTGVAFEMQYIDGDWKLNPYTSMMSLNLMGILNENNK